MRSLAILLVLVAGGCGGARASGGASAALDPQLSAGSYANRARPASTVSGAAIVAAVQHAADDVCRCSDGSCADQVVARLGRSLRGRDDVMLSAREQSAMMHAVARIDRCRARLFGRGEQAARVAERWAAETCACTDASCAALASERGAAELRRYGDAEGSDDELRRILVASRQVKSCMRELGVTGQR